MYLPEITVCLKNTVYWKRNKAEGNKTSDSNQVIAGMIKVVFFFSQIETLINKLPKYYLLHLITNARTISRDVLNFQVYYIMSFQKTECSHKGSFSCSITFGLKSHPRSTCSIILSF